MKAKPWALAVLLLALAAAIILAVVGQQRKELPSNSSSDETVLLPEEIPAYPGASLVSSSKTQGDTRQGISLLWETTDTIDKIALFYREALTQAGWEITSKIESQDFSSYSITKGETTGFIGVGKGEKGKMVISVTLGLK